MTGPAPGSSSPTYRVGPEPTIETTTLANGLRIVTERMPEATSVSIGFYVGVGSRDESDALSGASHFLEHLLFKGTEDRSARSISMAVDAVGGEINAFTSREHTAYYARLPAPQLAFGLELLGDVVERPAFRPQEIDAEREVILEELLMAEDTPDDVLHMQLMEAVFPGHPLGRETLGVPDTIESLGRDEIAGFHHDHYRPSEVVVVAAGDLRHEEVVDGVSGSLQGLGPGAGLERVAPTPEVDRLVVVRRPTEQVHLMFGWRGLHYDDPDRYAYYVANQVLGGGMSSRLFQEVREERGLAYSVYSSMSSYSDCGLATVYAGTAPKHTDEVLTVLDDVLDEMLADGITEEEHGVALGYLEGSMLLGLEDSGSRMARLGGSMIIRGEVTSIREHVERIRAVTREDVHRVMLRIFTGPRAVAAVGPFDADDPRLAASAARRR